MTAGRYGRRTGPRLRPDQQFQLGGFTGSSSLALPEPLDPYWPRSSGSNHKRHSVPFMTPHPEKNPETHPGHLPNPHRLGGASNPPDDRSGANLPAPRLDLVPFAG